MSYARGGDDTWNPRDGRDDLYRRRSPGPARRGRDGRQRSRSPVGIDRYQPGARARAGSGTFERRDDYRRRSPPAVAGNIDRYVPGQDPQAPIINPLPHPLTLDYQVGFTWFAEWWRKDQEVKEEKERQKRGDRRPPTRLRGEQEVREDREKEREKIQAAYDDYKLKLQAQLGKTFVAQHKDQEWFKERYDPVVRDPYRAKQAAFRLENYARWINDLDIGHFDDFSLEGIYKSDSNGAGGIIEKEEGEAAAANEVLGVGDLVPSKGGDLRDEIAQQPALLIKTIAPYVSREKLESFCKEHLGEGEGGFNWLSLSDPNILKKCHRIGWVMLNPGGDQIVEGVQEKRGEGRDEETEEGEEKMATETIEPITKIGVNVALEAIDGKSIEDEVKGNFTCHVGVHQPPSAPRKRALWDLFSAPERIERDLELATRLVTKLETELGEDINAIDKIEVRVEEIRSQGLLQPPPTNGSGNKPPKLEDEEGEDGEMEDEDEGAWDDEVDDEDLLAKKKKLDLLVEYLRRVHNFCFFCVFESDSVHELIRKCPGGHLRRPRASLTSSAKAAAKASAYGEPFPLSKKSEAGDGVDQEMTEAGSPVQQKQRYNKHNKTHIQLQRAFTWVKTYEDKLYQILEPDSVDIKKLGGKPIEEALEEDLKRYFKQEDEAKFRCKVPECSKLFKGEVFWRKHVEKRHAEWYEALKKSFELINNYVLDPAHITPASFRTDNTGPGQFPSNGMMSGTPRGFNLQNMGGPGGYPSNFGGYPVSMPAGGGGSLMGGQGGPMRRGGGRFGPRAGGPYDRQNGGRPRGGMSRGGLRFADAAPGTGATMGPKESVAGRTMKTYEDLDAVGGGADGELDY